MYRKIEISYERERLELPDGDFVDIDWLGRDRANIIVLSHGLEGNSQRHYITSIADYFFKRGWGVAAWNCRSCSGDMNRLPRLYSHIDAPDLAFVVEYIASLIKKNIAVAGVSMGGAITLNYMAKFQDRHPDNLIGGVAISAPTDVATGAKWLDLKGNKFYRNRFMKKMLHRAKRKAEEFPDLLDLDGIDDITTFAAYDEKYTAILTGCTSLEDFYEQANSLNALERIARPTLLMISADDPFMPDSCYPYETARQARLFRS
jgi:predicted alpha/beta-fold hydrolase